MSGPVVVTGGTGTIGSAIARRLEGDGCQVLVTDADPGPNDAVVFQASLPEDTDALIADLPQKIGGIVHALGVIETHGVSGWSDGMFERIFRANVLAPLRLVERLSDRLEDGASIVFVGSVAGLKTTPHHMLYGASKAALHHAALTLSSVLASRNIRVNVVAPGLIDGPLTRSTNHHLAKLTGKSSTEIANARIRTIPIGRIGDANDIAAIVSFLMSAEAGFLTGSIIPVTGGAHI